MKRKMMVGEHHRADLTLDWRKMTDLPARNGWYECYRYVIDIGTGKPTPVVCVGLYHDGKWRDRVAGSLRWREPVLMRDMTGEPMQCRQGVLKLAEAILVGYHDEFVEAYSKLLEPFTDEEVIWRYLAIRARLLSSYVAVLTTSDVSGEVILASNQRRVLEALSVPHIETAREQIDRTALLFRKLRKAGKRPIVERISDRIQDALRG